MTPHGIDSYEISVYFLVFNLSPRLCDLCFAEKPAKRCNPNMNFKNMSEDAPYRLAEMDHTTYMNTQLPSCWSVVPGWTLHTTVFDIMHNLFLGTGRDIVGSSLRIMLEKGCFDHYGVRPDSDEMFAYITQEVHSDFRSNQLFDCIMAIF